MSVEHDVAIVGMSCVFPKAPNLKQYWFNLANGVDGISDRSPQRWRDHPNFTLPPTADAYLPGERGGFLPNDVSFDPMTYGVVPNLVRHGDPDQFLMLAVIDQALKDAGIGPSDPVRRRADVIIGRGGYATGKLVELTLRAEMFDTVLQLLERRFPDAIGSRRAEMEDYLRSTLTPKEVDNVSTAVSNITASRVANRLDLRGAAYAVDAACASSLLAVEQGVWRLRTGQCDLAVAAGLFLSMSPTFWFVFHRLGALSPSQCIRPFDRRADGLLVGEGGGALILKRLEDARRDGDPVYAIIRGVGSASDGREVDVLAPSSSGQVLALERAYADAGVDRDLVQYLEMHGTGTLAGDQTEIASIKEFFGTVSRPATARAMGSVKSMIGHTMPAAGMAAMIKTALMLSNKVLAPSLHCEEPRPELADCPFFVVTSTRPWIHNPALGPRRAGVNAFGFGGINAHVVLEEVTAPSTRSLVSVPDIAGPVAREITPGVARESELFAFAAPDVPGLLSQLRGLEAFLDLDQNDAALVDLSYAIDRRRGQGSHKLALIARDRGHLRELVRWARERLETDQPLAGREEVYYSPRADRHEGKIAFILPGMGFPGLIGSYPDHLMQLCLHFPCVRAEFDHFEDRDRHPEDDVPTSSIFAPPATLPEDYRKKLKSRLAPPKVDDQALKEPEPGERYLAAMGVTLANWVGWVLLSRFNIPVDMVAGQSQGEMAALCACGVGDFHETAPNFWRVLNVDTRDTKGGRLAFAWASGDVVEPLVAEHPGTYLAIYMAPEGVIFGGDRDGLLAVAEKLKARQILVQLLPYPPIHTPALSYLRGELLANLDVDKVEIKPPKIDLYSSITTEKYPSDPVGIRDTLLLNVDHPLRIWQTIRRMHADGARLFVQVGGGHMAAHLERLLPDGAKATTAALDVDTRDPLTQLHHLLSILFTAGVPLDLSPLFEHRAFGLIDLDHPGEKPAPPRMATPLRMDWSPLYSDQVPPKAALTDIGTNAARESLATPGVESSRPIDEPDHARTMEPLAVHGLDSIAPGHSTITNGGHVESTSPGVSITQDDPRATVSTNGAEPPFDRRLPLLGSVRHYVPDQELTIDRVLSLSEDLFLADHLFVHAESKPLESRMAVLPLTMSMEFLAEAGALLAPGLGHIGFETIRGLRWIGLRDKTEETLRIEMKVLSDDPATGVRRVQGTFHFEGQASFSGVSLYGPEYRNDLGEILSDERSIEPWPFRADQVYAERFMFHGPSFHVLAGLDRFGNPQSSAALWVRPKDRLFASRPDPLLLTDPCLMDGIGQVVGLWTWAFDQFILPTGVEKIEFYRPTPEVGVVCPVRMEVVEFNHDAKMIKCHLEIEDGAGGVWVRVSGWTEWVMKWSKKYADVTRLPDRFLLGDEIQLPDAPSDACCVLVRKEDFRGIDADWAGRIFLHDTELPEYWSLTPSKRKRQSLASRSAAKDAARLWWARQHESSLPHPSDFVLRHDSLGRPFFEPQGHPSLPAVSVAHSEGAAIAVASKASMGIDLEPVERATDAILVDFATVAEQSLVAGLVHDSSDPTWPTRLWCAKEAAAKALGTGLQGKPKEFEAFDVDSEGRLLLRHEPSGQRWIVRTARLADWVIAYTVAEEAVVAGAIAAQAPARDA